MNSNNAATSGGAIFLGENAELQATDVEIRGNTAPEAPACWVGTDCTAEFTCCDMESSEVAVSGTGSVHFSYEGCPELPKLRSR